MNIVYKKLNIISFSTVYEDTSKKLPNVSLLEKYNL